MGVNKYIETNLYNGSEQCIYAVTYLVTLLQNCCLLFDSRIPFDSIKEIHDLASKVIVVVLERKKYKKELTIIGKCRILELITATIASAPLYLDEIII